MIESRAPADIIARRDGGDVARPRSLEAVLNGSLGRGRLHELFAGARDASSAAGFAAMLARRIGGWTVWLRQERAQRDGRLHPPGLSGLGIDPARLLLAVLPDPLSLLRAAVETLRCPEVGAAVIELWGDPPALDPVAGRRLVLAAEAAGTTALLLRVSAAPRPSAAHTRWEIRAAPSRALEASAPGPPALAVRLLRRRGGVPAGPWHVEWNGERACFHAPDESEPAPSGAVLPFPVRRPGDGGPRRAG